MKEDQYTGLNGGSKKAFDTDFLLRYLEGKLSDTDVTKLESSLQHSVALRDELARLEATQSLLQQAAITSSEDVLDPFFTDRLMKKLAPDAASNTLEDELAGLLTRLFRPVAIAGLFLALCLAVYNINLSNGYSSDPSTTESIFAMPPITSMAVYDLDYYAAQSETETLP
ncbi:MAG: hypothetical protein AB8G77_09980 [Rhodothermales bacterium]